MAQKRLSNRAVASVVKRHVVFDPLRRKVAMVLDQAMEAGRHNVTWEAGSVPSGVYLSRLEAGEFVETRQHVLLK